MPAPSTRRSRRQVLRIALAAGTLSMANQLGAAIRGGQKDADSSSDPLSPAPFPANGSVLVLLGTKGGPTPSPLRAAAANALVIDGQPYLIDCGNGVAQQLAKAGIRLPTLRDIFLTHHHSDHNADLAQRGVAGMGKRAADAGASLRTARYRKDGGCVCRDECHRHRCAHS